MRSKIAFSLNRERKSFDQSTRRAEEAKILDLCDGANSYEFLRQHGQVRPKRPQIRGLAKSMMPTMPPRPLVLCDFFPLMYALSPAVFICSYATSEHKTLFKHLLSIELNHLSASTFRILPHPAHPLAFQSISLTSHPLFVLTLPHGPPTALFYSPIPPQPSTPTPFTMPLMRNPFRRSPGDVVTDSDGRPIASPLSSPLAQQQRRPPSIDVKQPVEYKMSGEPISAASISLLTRN